MKKTLLLFLLTILFMNGFTQVEPLIQNNWQTFQWPYNAYYPEHPDGPNGHVGNACGYTAMARILDYWQFPVNGTGVLDFDDYFGNHWYINLENMNLDYSDMPYELDWNDPENVYEQTATLFLACGAIGEDIQIGFSHGIMRIPDALYQYMGYSNEMEVAQRWDFSREEWIQVFKDELDNGRPILIDGRTEDSPPPWEPGSWQGHFFVCDGYNENDKFHMNYMFGGIQGYYDIDSMGTYSAYHRAVINFEPENVNVEQNPVSEDFTVFPNPVKTKFNIDFTIPLKDNYKLQLTNLQGKILHTGPKPGVRTIDVSNLDDGLYFLTIINGDKIFTQKILILK